MVPLKNRMAKNFTISILGTQFLNPGLDPEHRQLLTIHGSVGFLCCWKFVQAFNPMVSLDMAKTLVSDIFVYL